MFRLIFSSAQTIETYLRPPPEKLRDDPPLCDDPPENDLELPLENEDLDELPENDDPLSYDRVEVGLSYVVLSEELDERELLEYPLS